MRYAAPDDISCRYPYGFITTRMVALHFDLTRARPASKSRLLAPTPTPVIASFFYRDKPVAVSAAIDVTPSIAEVTPRVTCDVALTLRFTE